jgi:alkylation response protein AidB-like acyl-CoA dehydrogenase
VPNSDFGSHRSAAFSRRLGARGWIGMTWPRRYGGGGRSMLERYVVTEELLAAGAPVGAHWIADRQSAPLLLRYGTEEQRLAFLPGIAKGEIFFSIGMSEPDAGSDLASIRTRAVPVAGGYEVTGTKIWASYADESHFAITLVRTSPAEGDHHHGLSQLILDLKASGVTIRPIINLAGDHDFNEIVLDRVFVPADRLVGKEGDGWRQVTSELAFERSGPERFISSFQVFVELVRRRPRSRAADRRGNRPRDRAPKDVPAHVVVDRGRAAGGRDTQSRSGASQESRQCLRARGPRIRASARAGLASRGR